MKFCVALFRAKDVRAFAGLLLLAAMPGANVFADPPAANPAATTSPTPEAAKPKAKSEPADAPAAASASPAPEAAKPKAKTPTDTPAVAAASPAPEATKSKAKPTVVAESAECVRTGQRVIATLARDDSGAASQFYNFYSTAFKCPPQKLAQAFGCLVNLQTVNPGLANPSPEQVAQCWNDPATPPRVLPQPQPPAANQ